MEPSRRKYRVPQPVVTRNAGENVLQCVALPFVASEDSTAVTCSNAAALRRSRILQTTSALILSSRGRSTLGEHSPGLPTAFGLGVDCFDALAFLKELDTTTLLDKQAESIVYPYHAYAYSWEDVCTALQARLIAAKDKVPWYTPYVRTGWETDLRFLGDWWLSLRSQDSATAMKMRVGMNVVDLHASATLLKPKKREVNRPFLMPEERNVRTENQLVADFALRLQGRLFRLEMLHIDELDMTPDRVHVLMLGGLLTRQRSEAEQLLRLSMERATEHASAEETERFVSRQGNKVGSVLVYENPFQQNATSADVRFAVNQMNSAMKAGSPLSGTVGDTSSILSSENRSLKRAATGSPVHSPRVASACGLIRGSRLHRKSTAGGIPCATVDTQYLLETVSFSICSMSTASLLVFLSSLAALENERATLCKSLDEKGNVTQLRPIVNADLSYNALTSSCFYCLTAFLPRTGLRRLSLRGNDLFGRDGGATRDFLLEGCRRLEELDLGHTNLSTQQICILIEALPSLTALRILNLSNVAIPLEKATAFARSVGHSQLWSVSLDGCAVCASETYGKLLRAACERNKTRALKRMAGSSPNTTSFFDHFYSMSLTNGWAPPGLSALPGGYGPYTNNDPSLFERTQTNTHVK